LRAPKRPVTAMRGATSPRTCQTAAGPGPRMETQYQSWPDLTVPRATSRHQASPSRQERMRHSGHPLDPSVGQEYFTGTPGEGPRNGPDGSRVETRRDERSHDEAVARRDRPMTARPRRPDGLAREVLAAPPDRSPAVRRSWADGSASALRSGPPSGHRPPRALVPDFWHLTGPSPSRRLTDRHPDPRTGH